MKILNSYQEKARNEVEDELSSLKYLSKLEAFQRNPLDLDNQYEMNREFSIQIDAPTGAGKTVLIGEIIKKDLAEYVTLVFTPGAGGLDKQTLSRLKDALGSRVSAMSSSIFALAPAPGTCLVANWEQLVSRDKQTQEYKNTLVREGDRANFFDLILKIGTTGMPLAIIIDESHYGKNDGTAIRMFLEDIKTKLGYAPLIIELSATPLTSKNARSVRIPLHRVIEAGFIRRAIHLNPASVLRAASKLSAEQRASIQIENFLLDEAIKQSELIDAEYIKEDAFEIINGKKFYYHCLIGIQMPNGAIGNEAVSRLEAHLRNHKDANGNPDPWTRENGKLVVYMSTDKSEGLKGIDTPDSPAKVLIYKQAVATGWDCPRAQILVGFRHMTSKIFTKQNLGRFVRTTQQKHYNNEILDNTYVFSNVGDLGQASFGDEVDYTHKYEKESLLKIDENGRRALSSFEEYKLPISHYAHLQQTIIPPKILFDTFRRVAIEENLASALQYSNSLELRGDRLKSATTSIGILDGSDFFTEAGETKNFASDDTKQYNDFVEKIGLAITRNNVSYGNNSQVARKLAKIAIKFYKDTIFAHPSEDTPYGQINKSILDILESEIGAGGRTSLPDWNDFAVEQLSLDALHLSALEKVLTKCMEHFTDYQVFPDLLSEEVSIRGKRIIQDDGYFNLSTLSFWAEAREDNIVGQNNIGISSKYATGIPTTGVSLREGPGLSGPELKFESSLISSVDSLVSYMKSPENKKGAFCLGVKTTDGKVSNFYPDYLLELKSHSGEILPCILEVKDEKTITDSVGQPTSVLFAKVKALIEYSAAHGIKTAVVYEKRKLSGGTEWVAITGIDGEDLTYQEENLLRYLAN